MGISARIREFDAGCVTLEQLIAAERQVIERIPIPPDVAWFVALISSRLRAIEASANPTDGVAELLDEIRPVVRRVQNMAAAGLVPAEIRRYAD